MNGSYILVVDDRIDIRMSVRFVMEDLGYQVLEADGPLKAQDIIKDNLIQLVLLDMNYSGDTTSGEEGLNFLAWLQKQELDIAAVAMTAWSNVELAVKAMQLGAGDFIEKPWKNQRLVQVVNQQLRISGLKKQNQKLNQRLELNTKDEYQWRSPCMLELYQQVENIASAPVNVLLTGENGTGKSDLAKYIHTFSSLKNEAFVAVNMGAISDSLFESEMFGHVKGAFTDAKSNRIGRFELAQNGTLFLDEIANIPLSQQGKLLRVLEIGEYEVLGSSKTQLSQVRIISASNGNFTQLIGEDLFREDLFYRLNTIELRLPALRERALDIIPLAEYFITKYAKKYQRKPIALTSEAKQDLLDYHWPGNIRELSHLMERALLLFNKAELTAGDLGLEFDTSRRSTAVGNSLDTLPLMPLETAEKQLIKQALEQANNKVAGAAKLLGLTKSSLYRRLEKHDDIQK